MEKVQLEIEIKGTDSVGTAVEKTKSLKTQLKDLKNQLSSGNLSAQQFTKISLEAGKLEDTIGDVNKTVKALSSDSRKLDSFVDLASGITGGFAAAQGAMAIFGDENGDLQQSLLKVQGAVAILNGLQAVQKTLNKDSALMTNLNTFAQKAYARAVGTTTGKMKVMRIAGMSLGIGLIVAAVGFLVANFDNLKKMFEKLFPHLAKIGDFVKALVEVFTDLIGVTSEEERGLDKLEKTTNKDNKARERKIELLKAEGGKEKEIHILRQRNVQSDIDILKKRQDFAKKNGKTLSDDEADRLKDLENQLKVNDANESKRLKGVDDKTKADKDKSDEKASAKQKEVDDKKKEAAKKTAKELADMIAGENETKRTSLMSENEKELDAIYQDRLKKLEMVKGNVEQEKLINDNANLKKEEAEKNHKQAMNDLLLSESEIQRRFLMSDHEKELDDIKLRTEEKLKLLTGSAEEIADAEKTITENARLEKEKLEKENEVVTTAKTKEDEKKKKAEQDEKDAKELEGIRNLNNAKKQIVNDSSQGILAAMELVSEGSSRNTALGKGIAIAQIATDTALAISALVRESNKNTLNGLTSGIAGAVQFASGFAMITTSMLKAKAILKGGGGGSAGGGGASMRGGASAPSVGRSNNNFIPTAQRQETKIFVTETDIRRVTKKVDGIYSQASIV